MNSGWENRICQEELSFYLFCFNDIMQQGEPDALLRDDKIRCGIMCNSATLPHKQPSHDRCQTSKSSTRHQILTGRRVTPVPSWRSSFYLLTFITRAEMEATKRWSSFRSFTPFFFFFFLPVPVRATLKKTKKKRVCMAVRHLSKEQRKSSLQKRTSSNIMIITPAWKGWWCSKLRPLLVVNTLME